MLCAIYKSSKKDETYLFVPKRDDFSSVPTELMQHFGTPKLVMVTVIKPDAKLAISDTVKVREALEDKGFYLQLPPPKENLLEKHKAEQKLMGESKNA
ncbi:YcgL domain-containing protein [Aliiglaciecola sp. CAU 1673]|uniref:YcgL domain-containing protein n=1 Tax=Aliiglaciecola sp. CAU 1673 TaxID=3032595 RepID=UPI0023D9B582|nr:YcgL domain-containing protein [Aliiglaciecola sp. CAU 1673]MDF2179831.1 YcgL domain-containing protein [Aliiglaciecola sp. CAU 1673]